MSKNITALPGIPIIHQPCFDQLWDFQSHSEEINELAVTLNKDGFAVFDFPEPNFNEMAERIKKTISPRFDWEGWRSGERSGFRIQDAWSFCEEVKNLAANEKMLDILSSLYGRPAFPFQTLNFAVGTQQAGHSDHVHFYSVPEKFMCAVWVALEDVDEQNGTLFYYPGSHNWIQLFNEHFSINAENNPTQDSMLHYSKFTDTWEILAEYYNVKPKVVKIKKGQAVLWTSTVVHGGYKIQDKSRTRWSQVSHYYFDDCVYTTPLANTQAKGKIFQRDITDISTGKSVQNKICGESLTDEEIQTVTPKPFIQKNLIDYFNKYANSTYRKHKDLPKNFSALTYLKKNADLLKHNVDPYEHYIKYGKSECRSF